MRWLKYRSRGKLNYLILDFNKSGASNKRSGAKFGPFLISVVAEITELLVENSHKINCRHVMSIRVGRVARGRSWTGAKSKMELFVTIVNKRALPYILHQSKNPSLTVVPHNFITY